ncbi:MAG: RHS repeat protein [bacterium]|nr:RHS repeat protein [bacterium]
MCTSTVLGMEGAWSNNTNNELLSFANTQYQYNENGNAVQLPLDDAMMFRYHYNAQDRLVKVEDVNGSTIAEYAYDPFGRRLWKEVGGTHAAISSTPMKGWWRNMTPQAMKHGPTATSPIPPGPPIRSG